MSANVEENPVSLLNDQCVATADRYTLANLESLITYTELFDIDCHERQTSKKCNFSDRETALTSYYFGVSRNINMTEKEKLVITDHINLIDAN